MQSNPGAVISRRGLSALLQALSVGVLGVLISLMPGSQTWQEDIGLGLLFKLRGQRPPPQEVVIVSLNGRTGEQLGLGEEIDEWPRSLHTKLINRLADAGVALIVFDIFFKKPRERATNERMADAMRRAANVLLVAYLEQRQIASGDEIVEVERLIPPTPILAGAAIDIAPFVLPKIPVKVSRFWIFHGDNEYMSLPAAAMHHLADPSGEIIRQLVMTSAQNPNLLPSTPGFEPMSRLLRSDARLRSKLLERLRMGQPPELSSRQRHRLIALLGLYDIETYPLLNFYGPPGTVTTIPVQQILGSPLPQLHTLKDKVVFVGYAGDYQPQQQDGFFTVFSQPDGLDLSGVEIATSAFANLLWRETLSPLSVGSLITVLLAYGVLITLLFRYLPGMPGIVAGMTLAGMYLGLVSALFVQHNLWLPWLVPLVLQTPLALILSLIWHYRQLHSSRARLKELFGFYLPSDVIDRLVQHDSQQVSGIDSAFGVCLASDAQGYTRLAETMDPQALQVFLNRYYKILFAPVRARDGVVSDVVGDAMLAIWPATRADPSLPQKACEAALEIGQALEASDLEPKLRTRIGLHAGELVMSHVGAIDHFEYRAVGDMVNTASRIENLNKQLGTSILASQDFVAGLQGIVLRELGDFRLAGKQQPISLYEIAATRESATPQLTALHEAFADALADWREGNKVAAYEKFKTIRHDHPLDGPTAYYLQQYREAMNDWKDPSA